MTAIFRGIGKGQMTPEATRFLGTRTCGEPWHAYAGPSWPTLGFLHSINFSWLGPVY